MLINCCQARSCLDTLAAKRVDALFNLPAQFHTNLGCHTFVALYLSERESAVGMLFQCLSSITGHTAKTLFSKAKKLEFSEIDGELAVA